MGGNPVSWIDPRGLSPALVIPAEVVGAGALACYLSPGCRQAVSNTGKAIGNLIFAKPKPGSKPKGCPTGTKPIDQVPGLDKDAVHGIKNGVGAGPRDWTGIAPNGDVITGDSNGDAVNHGPYDVYLP